MEDISLSVRCRTIPLLGAEPGQLIFSAEGDLALTAVWEGTAPSNDHGAYMPLVGANAFRLQWVTHRLSRSPEVLLVEGCEILVQPSSLATVPVGFDTKDAPRLPLGGLFFDLRGARVFAVNGDDQVSLSLATGTFAHVDSGRKYLGTGEWTLVLMRGEKRCFTTHVKGIAASTA